MIDLPDQRMYENDRALKAFAVDSVTEPHCFRFQVVDALTPPEGKCLVPNPGFRVYTCGDWQVRYIGSVSQGWENAYIRAAHRGREHEVQLRASEFPGRVGVHTVLTAICAEHLIAQIGRAHV